MATPKALTRLLIVLHSYFSHACFNLCEEFFFPQRMFGLSSATIYNDVQFICCLV